MKREKLLTKFKGRKGRFDNLSQWIENFENEVKIELETIRGNVKREAQKLKLEQEKLLDTKIKAIKAELGDQLAKAQIDFKETVKVT